MLKSSARLLRLLTLFQTRATWTGAELTSRLEVTPRTLRRDVDRLRTLGYPVDSTTGPAGGYKLGAGASLPPLMLDNEEGLAVAVSLQAAAHGVRGVEEPAQRALTKIDQVLPRRLRARLESLRTAIVRAPAAREPRVALGIVETLAAACAEHRTLALGYRDGQGQTSRRELEPQRLVLAEQRWYLVAWDRTRSDWRTFRVDRVEPPVTLGAVFAPRPAPDGDLASYVTRATSWESARHQARVTFEAPLATMREKIPPVYGRLTSLGPRRSRLETGGSTLDGIAMWLGWTGVPFTIEAPPELAAYVGELGERLVRASGKRGARRRG